MTRADWLNLAQACLVGLQSINLFLVTVHGNPIITAVLGAVIQAGSMFFHLMGINTPAPGQIIQLGLSQPPQK